ncbi:hypothetical protein BpHYR1_022280, partial [Brachionus plicatilis]
TDLFEWFYQNLREFTKILVNLRDPFIYSSPRIVFSALRILFNRQTVNIRKKLQKSTLDNSEKFYCSLFLVKYDSINHI